MARAMTCPNCGAPLRWKGEARVVECRYCATHVITDSGKKTEEPAAVRTKIRPRNKFVGALAVAFPLIIVSAAGFEQMGISLGLFGNQYKDVVALGLETTQQDCADTFGVEARRHGSVLIYFNHSFLDYANLEWSEDHPDHARRFALHSFETSDDWDEVLTRLRENLGASLEESDDGTWQWAAEGATFYVDEKRTMMHFSATPDSDRQWKERTRAMWKVAQAAVDEDAPSPSSEELDLLVAIE
jgi:hypothetical protein